MRNTILHGPGIAVAETTKGKIRGYVTNGLYEFKGVPYADAERFHAPHEIEPWEGEKECVGYGYVCEQIRNIVTPDELNEPHRYWPTSDHCLNLNVWTPSLEGKRPVMVWFHGGGFLGGSAVEIVAYEGENMAKYGDAVVITVNHRLNVLGYMDFSEFGEEYHNSGNNGTSDTIMALKWVHDNIANFGGDPENVTVFGQSGGGGKVIALLQSPAADGLFHKAIIMSGTMGVMNECSGSSREFVEAILKETGVSTVKELETVPWYLLGSAWMKLRPAFMARGVNTGGCPFLNGHYCGDPLLHGFRPETAKIPVVVGTTFAEGNTKIPQPFDRRLLLGEEGLAYVKEQLGENAEEAIALFREVHPDRPVIDLLVKDVNFRANAKKFAALRSALNDCTWTYLFDQDGPINGGCPAAHSSDISYVFRNTCMVPGVCMENTEELEEMIFSSVMAFARSGDPNCPQIPLWPASRPGEENTMFFSKNTAVHNNFDDELLPAASKALKSILERNRRTEQESILRPKK